MKLIPKEMFHNANNVVFFSYFFSHVINVKDANDFSKDQDPVHGVMKGENRKLKAGGYIAKLIMSLLFI